MSVNNTEKNRTMTVEEILQDPSLTDLHDFVRKVESTPASQLIPKKHEMTLMSVTTMETRKLFVANANLPIKTVIATILKPLTDDIPAPLMLKLTKKIIDVWTKLSAISHQDNQFAIAV